MSTVKRVFYAIAKDNLHTRRDISDALGLSFVTVSKAIDSLMSAELIFSVGKSDSHLGRRSDFIEVAPNAKILLIDLSGESFLYSYSTPFDERTNIRTVPYLDSLDFDDNITVLIGDIKKHIDIAPRKIAVALPGYVTEGKLKNPIIFDYSGFDIAEKFSEHGLHPNIMASCASAVEAFSDFSEGDAFISVARSAWGTFGRGKVEHWGKIAIDRKGLLTVEDALHASNNENYISECSARLLNTIDQAISPKRIFFSCDRLSKNRMIDLSVKMPKLISINAREMILGGLMELITEQTLNEI